MKSIPIVLLASVECIDSAHLVIGQLEVEDRNVLFDVIGVARPRGADIFLDFPRLPLSMGGSFVAQAVKDIEAIIKAMIAADARLMFFIAAFFANPFIL
jgi:hypothetical protein